MYDLVIIGGGPAGIGAAIYAARKKIKTLLIADAFGGQSIVSADIHNWIGDRNISGLALAQKLEAHVRSYEPDIEIEDDQVDRIEKSSGGSVSFILTTKKGKTVETRAALLCTGSRRKRLGVPGEDRLDGKGVAYCSICDAPLFQGKDVAVVGGGNAGLEAVIDLNAYAKTIYLLQRRDVLRGDAVSQEKIKSFPKVQIIYNALTQEIVGDTTVSGLRYTDALMGDEKTLSVQGVFVEIGALPNSDMVKGLVDRESYGYLVIDPRTQRTSQLGIWAAGDVTDALYKQNNIAVGDAIRAVLNIDAYLHTGH